MVLLTGQVGILGRRRPLSLTASRDEQVCVAQESLEIYCNLVDVLEVELTVDDSIVHILALANRVDVGLGWDDILDLF